MNGAGLPYVVLTIQSPTVGEMVNVPSVYAPKSDPSVLRPSKEIPGRGDSTKSADVIDASVGNEIPRDEPVKPAALALSENPPNTKPRMAYRPAKSVVAVLSAFGLGAGSMTATTAPRTGRRLGSVTVPVTVYDVGGVDVGGVCAGVGATVVFPQPTTTKAKRNSRQRCI